jgi:hypothetical protein
VEQERADRVRSPAGGAGGGGRALAGGRNSGSRRRSFERVGHGRNGSEKSKREERDKVQRWGPLPIFLPHPPVRSVGRPLVSVSEEKKRSPDEPSGLRPTELAA